MTRTIAFALSGLFAFANLAQAQYSTSGTVASSSGRLVNSRYLPDPPRNADSVAEERSLRTGRLPEMIPRPTMNEDAYFREDFKPLAFLDRVFLDELGRKPSDRESSYWLLRMQNMSRRDIALALLQRRPLYWQGRYDPRYGAIRYPDPAALYFPDPGGPFFKSPYFPNYEYARPIRAFSLGAQG